MHINKIYHLDIKPANFFMINKYNPVIADFGFTYSSFQSRGGRFGTPGYMAPEIRKITDFKVNQIGKAYSDKADIYSLGYTFY